MQLIETPDGSIYRLCDCHIFHSNDCSDTQKDLADDLFVQSGILVAYEKGGEIKLE